MVSHIVETIPMVSGVKGETTSVVSVSVDKFGCLQPLEKMLKLLPDTGKHRERRKSDGDFLCLRRAGFRSDAVVRMK